MGKGSPKPKRGPMVDPKRKKLTPEQMRAKQASGKQASGKPAGKGSIYKGTDKTTNKKDRSYTNSQAVVYADGSTKRLVTASQKGRPVVKAQQSARVYSTKKGNTIETRLNANDPLMYRGFVDSFPRAEMKTTTFGKDGRRESIVRRSGQNNSPSYVVSETQLARGTVRKGTVGKKKAY